MARFLGATWIPSPNFGYPRGTHGQLASNISQVSKSGEFWHSQQGRQAVSIRMFQDPALEISAHFLIPKIGKPVQMVDSSDPAWHAGGFVANAYYHGFEFEGGPPGNLSEPLTASQRDWGVRLTHWLREIHGTPLVYVRRDTLWEHNEVKNTACPSGRIPWVRVIAALEEDMPLNAEDKAWIKKAILDQTNKALANTDVAVLEIRNSLRGGDLPGMWWKVKGKGTIYYVEYKGGVYVRHHARNPQSYLPAGGNWKVMAVTQAQLDVTIAGPHLPDLKV